MRSRKNASQANQDHEIHDVDISLIAINLRLSYEQRIQKHDDALRFMQALKNAGRFLTHAKPWQSA